MASRNDYQNEKGLAKLVELFEAQERVAAIYAELAMNYPEMVELINQHDPSLAALRADAERRWQEHQAKQGGAA
jgi:thymidylate kinase